MTRPRVSRTARHRPPAVGDRPRSETDTWTSTDGDTWTATGTTRYAWDGSNLIAEFDGDNHLLRSFAYGPAGLLGITDYTSGSPVTYVPVMDATGSIVQLLDTSGNVVADYHYDAWGVRTASGSAANACPFGFAGMFQDATTGLYYAQARWYSATSWSWPNEKKKRWLGGHRRMRMM